MSDTAQPDTAAGRADAAMTARAWWWLELRPLLLRLHFYAGLLVGPFLLVAATTGLLYTLAPQLELAVHHEQLRVTVPPGATPQPLAAQVASALAAHPGEHVTEIRPAPTPDGTTRVSFQAPDLPEDYSRTVFVDPYTTQLRGTLATYGEWLPVRAWLDDLHRNLHLGSVGRMYSELAASWLWVLTVSGLAIWVARRRRDRRIRRLLLPGTAEKGRRRLRSWHAGVGVWVSLGLLFLSATGITWSQFAGSNVDSLRAALHWQTPSVATALAPGAPADGDVAGTADRVLTTARAHQLTGPVKIDPADRPGQAWVVQQAKRSWPEAQDSIAVDPVSGHEVSQRRFADWPLAAKLARWGVDAHMGLLFGLANQIVLAALALGILSVVVRGYRMWWLRRPTLPGRRSPAGSQQPGAATVVAVGVVAIGVGVFLPLLGASLLGFLLIDAVRARHRVGQS